GARRVRRGGAVRGERADRAGGVRGGDRSLDVPAGGAVRIDRGGAGGGGRAGEGGGGEAVCAGVLDRGVGGGGEDALGRGARRVVRRRDPPRRLQRAPRHRVGRVPGPRARA